MSLSARLSRAFAYLFIGAAGIAVLILNLGNPHSNPLGIYLTIVWSLLLLTAVPAAWATVVSRFRVEYVLIPWLFGGMFVASAVSWWRIFDQHNSPSLPAAMFFSGLCFAVLARWFTLSELVTVHRLGVTGPGSVVYSFFEPDEETDDNEAD